MKLSKLVLKNYFTEKCTSDSGPTRDFWQTVKPYFSKKSKQTETIQLDVNGKIISDPTEVAEVFNNHYLTIASQIRKDSIYSNNLENHPSLDTIQQYAQEISLPNFDFHTVGPDVIEGIIDRLPTGKAPGYDGITGNCIKAVKHTITNPLLCITNRMFIESVFPDPLKRADITPIYKKSNKLLAPNFRPVSVLICFSKIFEMAMSDQLDPQLEILYSKFISAYRKLIGCNSTLMYLVETWREALDNDQYVGVVMMDLSKAFDCLPHKLIVEKLARYRFSPNSCRLLHSYLENRTQRVKIGNFRSTSGTLAKGVPQGSILGPKIFNIFINDLLVTLSKLCVPGNYADDNTICCIHTTKHTMLQNHNVMQANPEKFHFFGPKPLSRGGKTSTCSGFARRPTK